MTTLESAATKYEGIVKKIYQAFFSPSQYEVKSVDREIIARGKKLSDSVWRGRVGGHNLG
jgi:hypothetical protein